MKNINTIASMWGCLSLLVFISCTENIQKEKKESQPVKVKTMEIVEQDLSIEKRFFADLQFKQHMNFISELSGKLTQLNIYAGKKVKKDEILLVYPPQNYALQTQQIQLVYQELEKNYQRQLSLYKKGAVSKLSLEQIKTQLDIQKKVCQQSNEMYSIKAPFDGVITDVMVSLGKEINVGESLFSIAKLNQIEASFFVDSDVLTNVSIHNEVYFIHRGDTIRGKVSEKALSMDKQRRAYRVKALFENAKEKAIAGSVVEVFLKTNDLKDQILVPWECVKSNAKGEFVYIYSNGKAKLKHVKIRKVIGLKAIIGAGIKKGDQLICSGIAKLKDQMPVNR